MFPTVTAPLCSSRPPSLCNRTTFHAEPQPLRCMTSVQGSTSPASNMFASQSVTSFYSLGEMLGRGSFGLVHAAVSKATGEEFAVKVVAKSRAAGRGQTNLLHGEVQNWTRLQHCRRVARLQGVFEDADSLHIVQELCYGGNLQELLDGSVAHRLEETEVIQAMQGILEFLCECHRHGICYGDVKPANFLLKSHYPSIMHIMNPLAPKGSIELKAVDFGSSQLYDDRVRLTQKVGTPLYMAPEMFAAGDRYGLEVDLWAAGVTMYQLLTGRFPFWPVDGNEVQHLDQWDVMEAVRNLEPDLTSSSMHHLSPGAKDLLSKLLCKDAGARMTAEQALEHPWLQMQPSAGASAAPSANNVVPCSTAALCS